MKTPLQQALELSRPQAARRPLLSPAQALRLWLRLYGALFFSLLGCAIGACICLAILLARHWPLAHPAVPLGAALIPCLLYCLGNILLLQGLPGARLVHNLMFLAVLATLLPSRPGDSFWLIGLGLAGGGLLLCNSRRYRALQALHQIIRGLRRRF